MNVGQVKRSVNKYLDYKHSLIESYFKQLDELLDSKNKYYFPVIMGICNYEQSINYTYSQHSTVSKIAKMKLDKEKMEFLLHMIK